MTYEVSSLVVLRERRTTVRPTTSENHHSSLLTFATSSRVKDLSCFCADIMAD